MPYNIAADSFHTM